MSCQMTTQYSSLRQLNVKAFPFEPNHSQITQRVFIVFFFNITLQVFSAAQCVNAEIKVFKVFFPPLVRNCTPFLFQGVCL